MGRNSSRGFVWRVTTCRAIGTERQMRIKALLPFLGATAVFTLFSIGSDDRPSFVSPGPVTSLSRSQCLGSCQKGGAKEHRVLQ
jgi:hypothetical protein